MHDSGESPAQEQGRDRRPRGELAVWPRPLRRSPPEQAKATGKWRDNIRRSGSGG